MQESSITSLHLSGPPWFRITCDGHRAQASINGELGIGGATARDFVQAIDGARDVDLTLNSVGGNMADGIEIFDCLVQRDTTVTVTGACMSAAIPILLAGKRRRLAPDARLMVHAATMIKMGSAEDLECAARQLRKLNSRLLEILIARTGNATAETWLKGDHHFDAAGAIAAGLADEVFEAEPQSVPAITLDLAPAETGPTDDERLLMAFLAAAGPFECRSKAGLARELSAWLNSTVKEIL